MAHQVGKVLADSLPLGEDVVDRRGGVGDKPAVLEAIAEKIADAVYPGADALRVMGAQLVQNRLQQRRLADRAAEGEEIQHVAAGAIERERKGRVAGGQVGRPDVGLDDAGRQQSHLLMGRQEIEVVNAITEAVEVAKHRGRLADHDVKRVTALPVVAQRLHAQLGQPFSDRLAVFEARFVLDFEDHGGEGVRSQESGVCSLERQVLPRLTRLPCSRACTILVILAPDSWLLALFVFMPTHIVDSPRRWLARSGATWPPGILVGLV